MTKVNKILVAVAILFAAGVLVFVLTQPKRINKAKAFIASKPWIRNGERTECYPDGKPKFKQIRHNGKSDGLFTRWYPNGQKQMEINFSRGIREGKSEGWHENGAKSYTGQFVGGKYDGKWCFFDTNGTQIAEATCKNGFFWDGTDARYINGILQISTYKDGVVVSSEKKRE
jgi:uncharacterized protein